jgi:hypothetical protein
VYDTLSLHFDDEGNKPGTLGSVGYDGRRAAGYLADRSSSIFGLVAKVGTDNLFARDAAASSHST